MDKRPVNQGISIPAHDEAAVVAQPGDQPLDLPAPAIAAQLAPILGRRLFALFAVRTNQFDAHFRQALAQGITVVSPIRNQPLGLAALPLRRLHLAQRNLRQSHFLRSGKPSERAPPQEDPCCPPPP